MSFYFKSLFSLINLSKTPFLLAFSLPYFFSPFKNHTPPKPLLKKTKEDSDLEELLVNFSVLFLKTLIIKGLFHSEMMINEGSSFVELLSEQETLQNAVSILLINNLKTSGFHASGLTFSKDIVSNIIEKGGKAINNLKPDLSTPENLLEKDLNYLFLRTLRDPDMKKELQEVVQWLLAREEIKEGLVTLFIMAVENDKVKLALTKALKATLIEILMNKSTVEKMKSFSWNVLEMDSKDEEGAVKKLVGLIQENIISQGRRSRRREEMEEEEKESIREFFFYSF